MTAATDLDVIYDPLQKAERLLESADLSSARELDLSGLGIGPFFRPDWNGWKILGRLDSLTSLKLDGNQITGIPVEGWNALGQLSRLTGLSLQKNEIPTVPATGWKALAQLENLDWLDVSGNQLTNIPEVGWTALARMSKLTNLYLSGNNIREIPFEGWKVLGDMKDLDSLFLGGNNIEIPKVGWIALSRLSNLTSLSLYSNRITMSGRAWAHLNGLKNLEFLLLGLNSLGTIPREGWKTLGGFKNLRQLNLGFIGTQDIPTSGWTALASLSKLQTLNLSGNDIAQISEIGWQALGRLAELKHLQLRSNGLVDIPAEGWNLLSRLPELETLELSGNKIGTIPLQGWERPGRFPKLAKLDISGNPLPEDLLVAAARSPQSLFEYLKATFFRTAHPRTVRLLLLGEPASGKTTLVEALKGNPSPCDSNRPETIGVNVQRVEKNSPQDGLPMYLATWDFAGQHMEYATHQFFLKSGGIYLILWKARLGSDYGQRDLWYWLELLKMRVKDPEFLLVTTHTGNTPSALDVREVQSLYPGCKGHFEVELSDGTGMAALQAKILDLAVASPSMKAAWPAPWLAVRDAIRSMRAQSAFISTTEFWNLCAEHEVIDSREQSDLADQLDKLGETVYYPNAPLSEFVILDPTWVTELVAKVVRDKQVRDRGGALTGADLNRIWGNLPSAVRDHVESLMDEYDLVYKMPLHQQTQWSVVVEALPSAPENLRILDIANNRPQTEMIYKFPKFLRHLPPGVPAWAFARARRLMKAGEGPWRNAAVFEDVDTNSTAIVFSSEIDREVRLRVAADYPPYFFGVLDNILRDTFKRYPGARPENRIPCSCQPNCKYGHPQEIVLKRKRAGKTEIGCGLSGEDVAISSLLEGVTNADTKAGEQAQLAVMRRQISALQNGVNDELIKDCPSIFTLAPEKNFKLLDTYIEHALQQETLELILYCEWEKQWHATQHSVYRFKPEKEWFISLKEKWSEFAKVTKRVAPLAGLGASFLGLPMVGTAVKGIGEKIGKSSEAEDKDPSSALKNELGLRDQPGLIDLDARHLLSRLIKFLDKTRGETQPNFGGLHPYHLREDGRLLWLCSDHREQYENTR